jgi:hypothetical protein
VRATVPAWPARPGNHPPPNLTGMTDWVPIVIAAIGSGALGSVITAYGTQTRERRQARTQAREAIRQVQNLTHPLRTQEQVDAALASLETSAMLAGLPKKLTALNRQALWIHWQITGSYASPNPPGDAEAAGEVSDLAFAAGHIASDTTQLRIDATSAHRAAGGAPTGSPPSWTYGPGPAPGRGTSASGNARPSGDGIKRRRSRDGLRGYGETRQPTNDGGPAASRVVSRSRLASGSRTARHSEVPVTIKP